ncbi:NAD(+)--dinitrogen-reductase ADP-D-ribosyltransferase [Cereibacter sphaeroides]|uniref:NAD(+)--dinitrogen-reductase ADP-D-ribosyltransferase n=1 Tax=Cereibacter sphaeroides TaxID=1063 RepID=UPI001F2FA417|nr:NAD(+)--dinitrogen-reductase ADP-D-ribosyltransferase [Cereibacter sphaeroides]MCE6959163.1 NAD(+)--dinitrogen-reductase ADP-D-ribosyltransferase [Cereibacter sphaeroides]MCE6968404.1 NAD(+)--dinitrogen-reductase ADP-D-ribosyltransferase [Cereibacter sphaeroides]MCE6974176.1 NAD(+)--dinitrogen-reductase ADP-D-ribosyltransferase [Cereibacter sphaeroides]
MPTMEDTGHPTPHGIGHSTNLVGRPAEWLASCAFNEAPVPLHIWGVVEMNRSLFGMLEQAGDLAEAAEAFHCYMMALFGLDPEQRASGAGGRRFRSSFLRLIQGWNFDSNSPEGAVLKGWVESRFGLCPCFHKGIIESVSDAAWAGYVEEKMSSLFHNNAIWMQLDLLFEFCQWSIRRFAFPGQSHVTLYRGINSLNEHRILERTSRREAVIRLNNLVSFTSDRDIAGCFGDRILSARVPLCKVLFYSGLLPSHLLRGEREFLAIGGDFRVSVDYV